MTPLQLVQLGLGAAAITLIALVVTMFFYLTYSDPSRDRAVRSRFLPAHILAIGTGVSMLVALSLVGALHPHGRYPTWAQEYRTVALGLIVIAQVIMAIRVRSRTSLSEETPAMEIPASAAVQRVIAEARVAAAHAVATAAVLNSRVANEALSAARVEQAKIEELTGPEQA